ncbi:MAG TPA: S8 family serine peptidase, partial [Planctomycetota bacterium]|nr:S8 family serine peptidase [Planctomycetota bacterium]
NSWGGGGYSQALKDAIDAGGAQGKLFVVAAGNSAGNNDVSPVYPASYTSDNLIAVAATTSADGLAYFSCYGAASVDLGAPGVDIYSTKPGNTYGLLSGTSMATPHVAGACAFLKSINPGLTGAQIKAALLAYTDPIPALQGKVLSNGRLNLAAAAVSVSGPHLIAEATVLSDITVVDGIISPGETVLVSVTLRNSGSETASGVTAALTTSDGFLSIVQSSVQYGTVVAGGQTAPSQPAVVLVSSVVATPQAATMALVVNGQDPDGDAHSWTIPVTFTVATAATISGQVVRTTGGAPVAGASVTFSGPSAGTVTTAVDGTFSRVVMDGTHTLVASAPDLSPSAPQVITTPPGQSGVLFSLGAPDITVDPPSVTVVVGQGETSSSQFTIGNVGDQPLHADLQVQTGLWQTTGLWHRSSWRDHDGGQSWYYGDEVKRTYNTGAANAGDLTSVSVSVPAGAPVLSFWSWRVTEAGLSWDRSLVQISVEGSNTWNTVLQLSNTSGTWQHHDIDLLAYAGQTIQVRFAFNTGDNLYNDFEGWYIDDVTINGMPVDGWLVMDASVVDLTPAGQQAIGLTVVPGLREPGTYTQNVIITSNDPDEAQQILPVTMVVEGRPSLVMGNQVIDDGAALASGDGDGFVEPGELVLFYPGLLNQGGAAALNVTAALATGDPYASIISTAAAYGDIAAGDSRSGSGFLIQIAANCPLDHTVVFTCIAQDGSSHQWSLAVSCTVVNRSRLSGVISDLDTSVGVANATVSVAGFTVLSAADGSYMVNGLSPGVWTASVSATGYTMHTASITVPGDAQWNVGLGAPELQVTPESLSAMVQYGDSVTHQLQIANPGNEPLDWSLSLPVDPSGYVVDTSDQTGGPAYVWNDIRATGTPIAGFSDDNNYGPFPLGFQFPFFEGTTNSVRICSNGWLSPTSNSSSYSNEMLPSVWAPRPLIAFYWRDLYFYSGATAHYQQVDAGTFVLQFTDVGLYGYSNLLLTCQVVLKIDGSITMYYQRVDAPSYGTVGVQNAAGTMGRVAAHNQAFLHNQFAVRFRSSAAGITISPSSGTVAPGGSTTVAVTVDSTLRGIGLHEDILTVSSNAPSAGVVQVPMVTRVVFGALPVADPLDLTITEDDLLVIPITGSDGDGDPLVFSVISQPQHGTLSGSMPYLTYQPDPDFYGNDNFTVVASDPYQDSLPAIINLTVLPINDPPIAHALLPLIVTVGQPFSYTVPADLFSDIEDGSNLPFTVTRWDGQPLAARFTYDPVARLISGTPIIEDIGTLLFKCLATDSAGASVATYLIPRVDVAPVLEDKLLASDGATGHRFATAVDFDGRFAVVGSPFANGRGQVYVFERVSGGWQQRQVLLPEPAGDDDRFGCAVSIDAGTLVIASAHPQGVRVSCLTQVADTWIVQQTFDVATAPPSTIPGTELDTNHVAAVALSQQILAVGVPFDGSGSLKIFERTAGTWTQAFRLNGGSEFQRLGWSVQVHGERVVAGAPRSLLGVQDAGAAIMVERQGGIWSGMSVITASERQSGDAFGMSVDLDEQTLAVGAPGDDSLAADAGAVHLFREEDGSWGEYHRLDPGILGFNGSQAFQDHEDQNVPLYPYALVAKPLRAGGPVFALTANASSGSISVVPWVEDAGNFAPASTVVLGGYLPELAVEDLNEDGFADLVAVDSNQYLVHILLGNGGGGFQVLGTAPTAGNPQSVVVSDLNHDGHVDLITANNTGSVSVLLGFGDGSFA